MFEEGANATYEQLSRLNYVDAVIKETFRVIPTVPILARYLTKPIEILGHQLKPGVDIFFCLLFIYERA